MSNLSNGNHNSQLGDPGDRMAAARQRHLEVFRDGMRIFEDLLTSAREYLAILENRSGFFGKA